MPRHPDFVPQGVIPAVLLPFHTDFSIDEPSFRAHLRDVASVQGLSAITVNAHSTEPSPSSWPITILKETIRAKGTRYSSPSPYGEEIHAA